MDTNGIEMKCFANITLKIKSASTAKEGFEAKNIICFVEYRVPLIAGWQKSSMVCGKLPI